MKTNIPFKAAVGYVAVAAVLVAAIVLVYCNTKSILAINRVSQEYMEKRDSSDRAMSALLRKEQLSLKDLADAMDVNHPHDYLHEKWQNLNAGKDSVVVRPRTALPREEKATTVEVVKTRKGFFRRLADAFKKERAETLSVRQDTLRAVTDTMTSVNVAENVADILQQIEKKERHAAKQKVRNVNQEMAELQMVNAQLALRSARQLNEEYQRERLSMQQTIDKAMTARQHLLWQIGLLAVLAVLAAVVLLWYIWRDARKERLYRESLEAANEETQRVMRQRERLLLTITHDIKAPAASISGFVDLLKDSLHDERARSCLDSIRHSATHLSKLVATLLDYHRLENGLLELHPVSFSPQLLVQQCAEEMRAQAQQKGLALQCDCRECTALYDADAFRIRQVLSNLVSNAVKYTDHGSVCISARVQDDNRLLLKVKDTGRGMTAEESRRAFQAFARLDNAQGIEGTGLGLAITHELVTLLGGAISLEAVPGKGCTFTVSIPVTVCAGEGPSATQAPTALHNRKILVLDDDLLQLSLLQEMLHRITDSSWQVFVCSHVAEALSLIHDEHPSLMLMDIEMPEANGVQLVRSIDHSRMTMVAMTAHDESILPELRQAGFDDCLFKPFCVDKLCSILGVPVPNVASAQTDTLLAFAGDDPVAAKEILGSLQQDLEDYRRCFAAVAENIDRAALGKAAHKLLPIAVMLSFGSVENLKMLSPERITDLSDDDIRACVQPVLQEIERFLVELRH